jgi:beta-N-acetylhexosaminidase
MRIGLLPLVLATSFLFSATTRAQDQRWVDSTLSSLSLEEKVGQLFVVEVVALFTNQDHQAYTYALDMIHRYHVGGFLLAGGVPLDIALITNRLQKESRVPLLVNADLEAGMTHSHPWRLSRGWTDRLPSYVSGGGTQFPSQMAIGATGNPRFAYEMGRITAIESRAVGIHWTNSPVADVNNNADNVIINTRSYGEDPAQVASMVDAYVRGAQEHGMIATVKHFPGHGDTKEDTHMGLPSLPFDASRLSSVELVPFKAGVDAGVKAVMTAHLALPRIDPTGKPATLSRPVLTGILRDQLGFNGIIMTDGMRMQGITDHFSSGEASALVVEAGGDVVLAPEDIDNAYHGVLEAVRRGQISETRINQSVRRVLTAKSWAGLDTRRTVVVDSIFTIVGSQESQRLADAISDASVTLLRNGGGVLPLGKSTRLKMIMVSEDPLTTIGMDLSAEIAPRVTSVSLARISNETGRERLAEIRNAFRDADVILVGVYLSVVAWKGERRFAPPLDEFLSGLGGLQKPVITVAFGDPYILGKLPVTQVMMTPHNGTVLAERSVARAIAGVIPITGKLPVTIPGRFKRGDGIQPGMK